MGEQGYQKLRKYVAGQEATAREMGLTVRQLAEAVSGFDDSDKGNPLYWLRAAGNAEDRRQLAITNIGRLMVVQGLRRFYELFPALRPEDSVVE
ncbi:MAG: hypothetical protein KKE05_03105 [Nanoarchaeota archaeon]|nr:hypothetical protein [Nanoarchaeota archaeon]